MTNANRKANNGVVVQYVSKGFCRWECYGINSEGAEVWCSFPENPTAEDIAQAIAQKDFVYV